MNTMMKKMCLFLLIIVATQMNVNAQNKQGLEDYVGRYVLPAGSLVDDAVITIVNDSVLNISASAGTSDLQYVDGEEYSLPQYGGTIVFVRDESNHIKGFKISIPMAGIESLEAQKEPETVENTGK